MKGAGQQVLKGLFFFNSTPNFCAWVSQTLLLLLPMVRETTLLQGVSVWEDNASHALPNVGSGCCEEERVGLERSSYGRNWSALPTSSRSERIAKGNIPVNLSLWWILPGRCPYPSTPHRSWPGCRGMLLDQGAPRTLRHYSCSIST